MDSKRSVIAFSFFNKIVRRRRRSVPSSDLISVKKAAETGTSPSFFLSSLRSLHTLPEVVSSPHRNHVHSGYDFNSVRDLDQAHELFDQMLRARPLPSVVQFTKLLSRTVKMKHYRAAVCMFREMRIRAHAPSFHTYCVLLTGFFDNGHIEEAMSLYSKLGSNGNGSHVFGSIIIDGLCKTGQLNIARGVLSNLIFKGQHINVYTYNAMINGLCQEGKTDAALDLFRKMGETDCLPDTVTYTIILQELVRVHKYHDANLLLDEMAGRGVYPNGRTLTLMNDLLAHRPGDSRLLKLVQKIATNVVM
ncbi:hypothetical protein DM860_006889 [Cuscuta australis]|uniref:Pentacotripeptide-repeat region of PRORP domain-containing protein n=1 Tax=Cuscuta australis TaxID=267555 RepID=A0A328E5L2_9ASTE|nr:hypothetical protein DM860_006889 [Cuscuta australis]